MTINQVDPLVQKMLAETGWYGFLLDLRDALPVQDLRRKKIEEMIVMLKPKYSCSHTVADYGFTTVIRSLMATYQTCAPEFNAHPCPDNIQDKLAKLINY